MDERPIKTKRQITLNGWDREDEDEERKPPTTRAVEEGTHGVSQHTPHVLDFIPPVRPIQRKISGL